MVRPLGGLLVLLVSLLVGGLAIHVGAIVALKSRDYTHAVVTAALGSLAWWLLDLALSEVGFGSGSLASLLGLVVWIGVLKWRYRTNWPRAAVIGIGAWIAALVALAVLASLGVTGVGAYGIPV